VRDTPSNTAGIVLDYVGRVAARLNQAILVERLQDVGLPRPAVGQVELEERSWFNGNLESRWYHVPGVIALIVMLITLMLGSMAVVREKERGTMEQILVSPIKRLEFILGKTVPFTVIGFFDVFVITVIALWWFEIPLRGNFVMLLAATGLFLMSTLGLGLFSSTVSQTQQQAMIGTFFVYFPGVLLSGFMFPIENMPQLVQWGTYVNPLRYFLVIIRGVFLKGVGAETLWPQMAALLALGLALMAFAVNRMQQSLT